VLCFARTILGTNPEIGARFFFYARYTLSPVKGGGGAQGIRQQCPLHHNRRLQQPNDAGGRQRSVVANQPLHPPCPNRGLTTHRKTRVPKAQNTDQLYPQGCRRQNSNLSSEAIGARKCVGKVGPLLLCSYLAPPNKAIKYYNKSLINNALSKRKY